MLADRVRPVDVRAVRTSARACRPPARRSRRRTSVPSPPSVSGSPSCAFAASSACTLGASDGRLRRVHLRVPAEAGGCAASHGSASHQRAQVALDLLLDAVRPAVGVGLRGQDQHGQRDRRRGRGWSPASRSRRAGRLARTSGGSSSGWRELARGCAIRCAAVLDAVEQVAGLVDRVDRAAVARSAGAPARRAPRGRRPDRAVDAAAAGRPHLAAPDGSGTIAKSAATPWRAQASPPTPLDSSSVLVHTTRSPRRPPAAASASAAITIAAMPPFMSHAPRPVICPSATCGSNGSCAQPSSSRAGTTSMWPLSSSERPPPQPRSRAASCGRPAKPMPVDASADGRRRPRASGSHTSTSAPRRAQPLGERLPAARPPARAGASGRPGPCVSKRDQLARQRDELVPARGDRARRAGAPRRRVPPGRSGVLESTWPRSLIAGTKTITVWIRDRRDVATPRPPGSSALDANPCPAPRRARRAARPVRGRRARPPRPGPATSPARPGRDRPLPRRLVAGG